MTARINCPLCEWFHDDPGPNQQSIDPMALAGVFGPGVFAVHALNEHARKIEEMLAAHFKTHTTVEWLRKVTALRKALESSPCPRPIDDDYSVDDCIKNGHCGCDNNAALADKPRFTDGRGNSLDHLVDEPPK